jgi:hypothetical protein
MYLVGLGNTRILTDYAQNPPSTLVGKCCSVKHVISCCNPWLWESILYTFPLPTLTLELIMLWVLNMVHFHFTQSLRTHQSQNQISISHSTTLGWFSRAFKISWSQLRLYPSWASSRGLTKIQSKYHSLDYKSHLRFTYEPFDYNHDEVPLVHTNSRSWCSLSLLFGQYSWPCVKHP